MAEVIQLTQRRLQQQVSQVPATGGPTTLYFDLASPYTYLVAERVERHVGTAIWRPAVLSGPLARGEQMLADVQQRARVLRMPLVWPERFPLRVPSAMRVATYANEQGCGAAFAIAAGRLAFCGGFDLEDPEILADGAAAAGLDVDGALVAAREPRRDHQIQMAGRAVGHAGGALLPALEHKRRLYCGEPHITAWLSQARGALVRPSVS
jgi:2-hydroxychromene-2-carboxylate isomerase